MRLYQKVLLINSLMAILLKQQSIRPVKDQSLYVTGIIEGCIVLLLKSITMPEQPNQLNIEISEEVAEGEYANLAIITHSHAEFAPLDFVNVMPGTLEKQQSEIQNYFYSPARQTIYEGTNRKHRAL